MSGPIAAPVPAVAADETAASALPAAIESIAALVDLLLEATPEPPPSDADPAEVLAAAAHSFAVRGPLLVRLHRLASSPAVMHAEAAARLAIILERDARWTATMTRAQHELGQRMRGTRRFRTSY